VKLAAAGLVIMCAAQYGSVARAVMCAGGVCPSGDTNEPPTCTNTCCVPGSSGGGGGGGGGGGHGGGGSCCGCPTWTVSEPYINLRLDDEPLGYQPPIGPRVSFHLSYRQRGSVTAYPAMF